MRQETWRSSCWRIGYGYDKRGGNNEHEAAAQTAAALTCTGVQAPEYKEKNAFQALGCVF